MKPTLPVLVVLLACSAPLSAQKININIDPEQSAKAAPAAQAAPASQAAPAAQAEQKVIPPVDGKYTNEQKMQVYGFIVASQLGMPEQFMPLIRSKEELNSFLLGIAEALTRGQLPYDGTVMQPQLEELIKTRSAEVNAAIEKRLAEMKEKNSKESAEFLAKLDTQPNIKKSASGLRYEITKEGSGTKAKPGLAVIANFTVSTIGGQIIDSSEARKGPQEFVIDTSIPGLKEGFQLIGVGGKAKLYIPAEIGFGDTGRYLEPGMLAIFEFEIVDVKEPTKQPEEKK